MTYLFVDLYAISPVVINRFMQVRTVCADKPKSCLIVAFVVKSWPLPICIPCQLFGLSFAFNKK